MSLELQKQLVAKGLPPEKCILFPNWVKIDQIYPMKDTNPLRTSLGVPERVQIALYAGNLGHKQGLETVVEAARRLQDRPNLLFIICGDGVAREDLEDLAIGLNNLRFLPIQSAEKLNQLLNLADIHLLPQKAGAADLVMLSKLNGKLANGKPVIAAAFPDTGVGKVVGQTGVLVPPGDPNAMADAILTLTQSKTKRARLGEKGRAHALAHSSARPISKQFYQKLNDLAMAEITSNTGK
jgi:colanic acid biosynthesis glycosyl transferase WcaI